MATIVEFIRDLQIRRGSCVAEIADIDRQLAEARDYLLVQVPKETPPAVDTIDVELELEPGSAEIADIEQLAEPEPIRLPVPDRPEAPPLPASLQTDHALEQKLVAFLRQRGFSSLQDIAYGIGTPIETARLLCSRLVVREVVTRLGRSSATRYGLVEQQQHANGLVGQSEAQKKKRLAEAVGQAIVKASANGHGPLKTEADDSTGWTGKCAQCQAIAVVEMTPLGHIETRGRAVMKTCVATAAASRPIQPGATSLTR